RRSQQRGGRSRHRLTDLRPSLGGGDQSRQPAQGSEILGPRLRLLIEARVLQTDGRLGSKRGGDRHVFGREAFFTLGADTQRSEHLVAYAKGHAQKGAVACALVGRSMRGGEPMIVGRVREEQGYTRGHDNARET